MDLAAVPFELQSRGDFVAGRFDFPRTVADAPGKQARRRFPRKIGDERRRDQWEGLTDTLPGFAFSACVA
jgi:hypothetical protein